MNRRTRHRLPTVAGASRPVAGIAAGAMLAGLLTAATAGSSTAVPTVTTARDDAPARVATAIGDRPATTAFALVGRYATGLSGTSAEIASLAGSVLAVSNADDVSVDIVDVADPSAPTLLRRVDLSAYGAAVTSVSAKRRLIAVAVAADPATDPGQVLVLNRRGQVVGQARVGALPDAVTFTPDGKRLVVANEGEPNSYGQPDSVDPEGSVSIVQVPGGLAGRPAGRPQPLPTRTATFRAFNDGGPRHDQLPDGVRIFGPGASVAQDLEPEYSAVSPDSRTAFVTLQENNGMAIVDIPAARVRSIVALGTQDHGEVAFDPSDRDAGINIATWPQVRGLLQPDQAAAFSVGGRTYVITANEGDARDYDGFSEEARAAAVADTSVIPAAADPAQLGRLTVTTATPARADRQRTLYSFGGRSMSIWTADGARVWDSGDLFEQLTARVLPGDFNSDNEENDSFDSRSDNKGPEPEAAAVATIDGRRLAFVGLERVGGVVVLDVTNPRRPSLVQYLVTREFGGDVVGPDSGPEGISVLPNGPGGQPLVAVSNEVSGTVALFQTAPADGATDLTVLHNNDGESVLRPFAAGGLTVGGVAAFKSVTDREIRDARDAGRSVVNVYAGDAFLAGATLTCSAPEADTGPVYDAIAQRRIAYDAHIFGNHEFDFTPDFLERFVREFETPTGLRQPFLSANLDFSAEPGWADLLDADGMIVGEVTDGRVVARSAVITDPTTTARIGIVGATTPELRTISSPRDVAITSSDIPSTATLVQAEIDRLADLGVTKVVVASHLQNIAFDRQLVNLLRGVDVAVAGGGDELLANPGDPLIPGDGGSSNPVVGPYPRLETDADGGTVPVVTTNGNYKYVGRLDVALDGGGTPTVQGGGPRRVIVAGPGAPADAVVPDPALVAEVQGPVEACLDQLARTPVAATEVVFDRSRAGVRARQSNAGNLVTDAWLDTYDRYADNVGLPPRGGEERVLAIQNGGGIRDNAGDFLPSDGEPGVISRLDVLNMLPFDNTMVVVQDVTPSELKEILQRAAASLPNQGGQFLQVAGFSVTYDPARTAQVVTSDGVITVPGERVREVVLDDGTVVVSGGALQDDAPNVAIVTNNFTAGGGDNYPTLAGKPNTVLRTPAGLAVPYELALREYLATFPAGAGGLPSVPSSDERYSPFPTGTQQRITVLTP
jgi:2',3'-cyclic-nucleotide 2'-phosphodiesterase (5'-nucleotidase family)